MVSLRRRSDDAENTPDSGWSNPEESAGFNLLPGQPLPAWAVPPAPEPEPPRAERTDPPVEVFLVHAGVPAEGFAGEVTSAPPLSPPPTPLFLPPQPPPGSVAFPMSSPIAPAYDAASMPAPPSAPPAFPVLPEIPNDLSSMPGVVSPIAEPTIEPVVENLVAPQSFTPPSADTWTEEQYAVPTAIPGMTFSAVPYSAAPPQAAATPEMSSRPHIAGQFEETGTGLAVYAPPQPVAPAAGMSSATLYDVLPDPEAVESHRRHGTGDAPTRLSLSRKTIAITAAVVALIAILAYAIPNYVLSSSDDSAGQAVVPTGSGAFLPPVSAAGMTRLDGAIQIKWSDATRASQANQGIANTFAATYGTGGLPKAQIWGGVPATEQPVSELTNAFKGFERATRTTVLGITTVAPTARGGVMKCGSVVMHAKPSTVCFWTDPSSFGGVFVIGTTPSQRATAMTLRATVEAT